MIINTNIIITDLLYHFFEMTGYVIEAPCDRHFKLLFVLNGIFSLKKFQDFFSFLLLEAKVDSIFALQELAVLIQTLKDYLRAFREITFCIIFYHTFKK